LIHDEEKVKDRLFTCKLLIYRRNRGKWRRWKNWPCYREKHWIVHNRTDYEPMQIIGQYMEKMT